MFEISSHITPKALRSVRSAIRSLFLVALLGCAGSDPSIPPPAAPPLGGDDPTNAQAECAVAADCEAAAREVGFNLGCTDIQCVAGACFFAANEVDGASCDDGNACTEGDVCDQRYCAGVPKACDDEDPCTDNTCEPATGACTFPVAQGAPCDDNLACTQQDACDVNGLCIGEPTAACQCLTNDDCAGLSDEDRCQGIFVCQADYTCAYDPSTKVVCDAALSDDCNVATCLPETGECAVEPTNESAACIATDDPCVDSGICVAGVCEGPVVDCGDDDPCTTDFCVSSLGGCQHEVVVGASCDDDDLCTSDDTCLSDGSCLGSPVGCGDGNPCTAGICDPATGECGVVFIEGDCIDDDPCSVSETCVDGQCLGVPMDCDDGKPCTEDVCKVSSNLGYCANTPRADLTECDLGDDCTVEDYCLSGECVPGLTICECEVDDDCAVFEDADPCTPTFGCVVDVFPKLCEADVTSVPQCEDTGLPCLLNICQSETGQCGLEAAANLASCDDGDPCSELGVCLSGVCTSQPLSCEDGDPCTSNLCVEGACVLDTLSGGQVLLSAGFDQGLPEGWSVSGDDEASWQLLIGDDVDSAEQYIGSVGVDGAYPGPAQSTLSTDFIPLFGQRITLSYRVNAELEEPGCGADVLQVGILSFGVFTPLSLSCESTNGWLDIEVDLSPYRNQSPRLEFRFISNGVANTGHGVWVDDIVITAAFQCVDEDACTESEVCVQGQCDTESLQCDDGDNCTADSCDPDAGCIFEPLESCTCDVDLDCPPLGDCLTSTCDDGLCVAVPVEAVCDDDDACTISDSCHDGVCAGAPLECDDGQPCTTDTCSQEVGCLFSPVEGPCDDGDPCTSSDLCVEGSCQGQPIVCDTGNPCAQGACQVVDGQGVCQTTFLHDGQLLTGDTFDGLAPGQLPAGWVQYADGAGISWASEPGTFTSAPTSLTLTGLEAGLSSSASVEAPQHVLPLAGGYLTFHVNIADVADPGCDLDVLTVRVDEVTVAQVCDGTDGWTSVEVALDQYIGLPATLSFEFSHSGAGAIVPSIYIDDVALTATHLCPNEDICITGVCVLGTCVPEPVPGCP